MARLVQQHLDAAGQDHGEPDAEAHVLRLAAKLHALRVELGLRGRDVVAEQAELVVRRPLGGVNAELGRRQREDQPAVARVDMLPAKDVAKRSPQRLRLGL